MYFEAVRQMRKMLGNLNQWLEAAAVFADLKKFDANILLAARLAPDQFALIKQVQTACDTAKLIAARLAGKQAPPHPDTEQSLADLQARIRTVIEYLDGFTAADFEGAATRVISQPRWEGRVMSGADYFIEHGLPNFFFHTAHTYAILRHNGVGLGKRDYLGPLSLKQP